jgi:hypothetical protein
MYCSQSNEKSSWTLDNHKQSRLVTSVKLEGNKLAEIEDALPVSGDTSAPGSCILVEDGWLCQLGATPT